MCLITSFPDDDMRHEQVSCYRAIKTVIEVRYFMSVNRLS